MFKIHIFAPMRMILCKYVSWMGSIHEFAMVFGWIAVYEYYCFPYRQALMIYHMNRDY